MKENTKNFFRRNKTSLRALAILLSIAMIIAIPITVFVLNIETPYFIIIDSDEDFLQWSVRGNGTIENPYVIAGHKITVPEDYETQRNGDITTCTPDALIRISGVTKSFIIENNTLTMKNKCGQNMISIYNIEVPFIVRNNEFVSAGHSKDAISISSVNGSNSLVKKNRFTRASIETYGCKNISFVANNFYNTGLFTFNIRESFNISFQHNTFINSHVIFYDSSDIILHNNTFDFRDTGSRGTIFGYSASFSRFTNNTFFDGGLGIVPSDRIPLAFEGNTINGKPLGFFYNQTNLSIDNSTEYGQIILLQCSNATVRRQMINNTSYAVQITECINTTVTNCNFTRNYCGVYVYYSNNTKVEDNGFHYIGLSEWGIGVRGRYSNGIYLRRNLFVKLSAYFSQYECTDVVEEDNTIIHD